METAQIVTYVLQTVGTLLLGALAFFIKRTLDEFKASVAQLKSEIEKTDKKAEDVKADLAQLKADLPLVYTLREDFIRTLNNVDKKMSDIDGKLDRLLQSRSNQ